MTLNYEYLKYHLLTILNKIFIEINKTYIKKQLLKMIAKAC